jgi:predicted  nucleic acid-binding Zn-ribbon protein
MNSQGHTDEVDKLRRDMEILRCNLTVAEDELDLVRARSRMQRIDLLNEIEKLERELTAVRKQLRKEEQRTRS